MAFWRRSDAMMHDATRATKTYDQTRADAFMRKMRGVLNDAALALLTALGHRTGLFEALGRLPPSTSEAIAVAAALDERYVREWLGGMVTAGVIEYDPEPRTFRLPAEHAAFLVTGRGPLNLGISMQFVPMLASVQEGIVRCFQRGGGLPYSAYHRFHEVMAAASGQLVVAILGDAILPLSPGLTAALERGIDVLDVGCGSGGVVLALARRYPRSRFRGLDLSPEAIAAGTEAAAREGLGNVTFVTGDAARLEDRHAYDLVTSFDAVHDQAHPAEVLSRIARALRPDGVYLMQEISGTGRLERDRDHPLGPYLYTVSTYHCMSVSLAAGGAGLGTMWGRERALAMLDEAGFADVRVHILPNDIINEYYVARLQA
jgi:SAM-dependent methyltransferase